MHHSRLRKLNPPEYSAQGRRGRKTPQWQSIGGNHHRDVPTVALKVERVVARGACGVFVFMCAKKKLGGREVLIGKK